MCDESAATVGRMPRREMIAAGAVRGGHLVLATADMPRGRLDVSEIACLAARATDGRCPDEVITDELHARGLAGSFGDFAFRRVYLDCVTAWLELQPSAADRLITAEALWAAYDAGESYGTIARRAGLAVQDVADRSRQLGFEWKSRVLRRGPCLRCGEPRSTWKMTGHHVCDRPCAPAAAAVIPSGMMEG